MRRRHPLASAALSAILLTGVFGAGPAASVEYQFPPGNLGFHTYEEMVAEVARTATRMPSIVRRFSIGRSHLGRELWAVKVSDNVELDENEPEVLFDGLHHGDEHMSLEMTLAILRWLSSGYGIDPSIKKLVDSREIYIIFAMNPDGATYDIANRRYHHWRKSRQPTPGSTAIGTDLNRNYDYRWGCCGGASSIPSSSRFRGPKVFSAPETRAFRDFVRSRVVGGRQQITASISFHTTGRLVMWPYGYTKTNVPADMSSTDQRTFVAMAAAMTATNRYRPIQASDLYISSGTSRDWLYGRYRIFAFTFELSTNTASYPPDESIGPETERNKKAVLYLIGLADCPYRAIGRSVRACRIETTGRA